MSQPTKTIKLLEQGLAKHRSGDFQGAEQAYRDALASDPKNANAWYLRSVIALNTGDAEQAIGLLQKAVLYAPKNARFHNNLGEAYRVAARLSDAEHSLERAIALDSRQPEAHANLAVVLEAQGRIEDAVCAYQLALSLNPELPGCAAMLVNSLREHGDADGAIAAFEGLRKRASESADLFRAAGKAYADKHRLDEAALLLGRAVALDPGSADALIDYAGVLANRGHVDEALALNREAVELAPHAPNAQSNLLFAMMYHPATTNQQLGLEASSYQKKIGAIPRTEDHQNEPLPERRLRVGFVSSDLCMHPVASFLLPLLRHHDREQVESFCYSNTLREDSVSAILREHSDHWINISRLDDQVAAERIRADGIDILFDLNMHTAGNRLPLFARKPAPVQASWLSYAGTTGVAAIDYRLSDVHLDPPQIDESSYSEQTLRLPETFWCYEPLGSEPPVCALPALQSGHLTFGCLNLVRKITGASLSLWAPLLKRIASARLLLVAPEGDARTRILAVLSGLGVDSQRVTIESYTSREAYFELYHRIDCGLDPIPYNGGTTTLDAAWMGVPTLTLRGHLPMGRAGTSINRNLGLDSLVADTTADFVAQGESLCRDLKVLGQLRASLRERLRASPLMDAARFSRHMEQAYRSMWMHWCETACETARPVDPK